MKVSPANNEFLNKNLQGVVNDGLEMSDMLRAATFVLPNLDFSTLADSLFEEACFLIQERRRGLYADIFMGEIHKRGYKDEVGYYYPTEHGRYRINSAVVAAAHFNHIEKPWFDLHPGASWWQLICYVSNEIEQPTMRHGLLAAALAKEYAEKRIVEIQAPWTQKAQQPDFDGGFGNSMEYAAGLMVKALRMFK